MKRLIEYSAACLFTTIMIGALLTGASAQPRPQSTGYTVALPLVLGGSSAGGPGGNPSNPGGNPSNPTGNTPAELVGTWYSGQLLNTQLYDPAERQWHDAGGLGHTYTFEANGTYMLASALEIKSGMFCESHVWKYERGTVQAEGANLLLTPSTSRTRTVVDCGSHTDTELEGDHATITVPWQLGLDAQGHTTLQLNEAHGLTSYFKDGLSPQMLGAWRKGDVHAEDFYDPAANVWAAPTGEGEWYRFNADGSYQHGEVALEYGAGDCNFVVLTYQTGRLSGSGSTIMLQPEGGMRTRANLCDTDQFTDQPLGAGDPERWIWSLGQADGASTLGLIRIEVFRQRTLVRDE
jgi:hypothetical protein